jgi:hypothetical protein
MNDDKKLVVAARQAPDLIELVACLAYEFRDKQRKRLESEIKQIKLNIENALQPFSAL